MRSNRQEVMFGSVMESAPNNHPTLASLPEQIIDHLDHKTGGSESIRRYVVDSTLKLSSLGLNQNNLN